METNQRKPSKSDKVAMDRATLVCGQPYGRFSDRDFFSFIVSFLLFFLVKKIRKKFKKIFEQ